MKARDYFTREGQACASTGNLARFRLALHRAFHNTKAYEWILSGYHNQKGHLKPFRDRERFNEPHHTLGRRHQ